MIGSPGANGSVSRTLPRCVPFELLRREYDAALTGSIRLSRHRGVSWSDIADALGLTEVDAIATYPEAIGVEAEAAAEHSPREQPADTKLIEFLLRCRDDAAHRLAEAIERAKAEGVPGSFIESVVSRSEEEARYGWPTRPESLLR